MSKGGIDYGMGRTNIDRETGIRFGVVNQNEMGDGFFDSVENEYAQACPKCGTDLTADQVIALEENTVRKPHEWMKEHFVHVAPCPHCEEDISPDDVHGEEPIGSYIDEDGIKASIDSQGDIFVLKSPFYTHGIFCSPCAPGAVSVGVKEMSNDEDCPRGYCLPYSWFREDERPKPGTVFRVKDNSVVNPEDDDA